MEATFNQWEFFPINLSTEQITNPLKVISDFFSDDSLNGHLERLLKWRDFVLKADYYRGLKESPAGLLYFYSLNLRLVEATHLLLKSFPADIDIKFIRSNTFPEFADVLTRLSEDQRLDLYAVLSGFFATYNLQQYREQLYEWLEHGLSRKGADEFITSIDLITVYENLQRLYSATWLIFQQLPDSEFFIDNDKTTQDLVPEISDTTVYGLQTVIPEAMDELIRKIVYTIKSKVLSLRIIFYLGTAAHEKLYFLVLTSDDESKHAHSLAATIEESCKEITEIHPVVLHVSKLFMGLAHGNRFFQHALRTPIVYLSGDTLLPSPYNNKTFAVGEKVEFNWKRWYVQGKDFLSGAEFYINRQSFGAALFSLHQSAECLLTAIIKAVLDYNIGGHNLTKLVEMTRMFTQDIAAVFNLGDEEKARQFDMLKQAYVNVRYKDNYEPGASLVQDLYSTIKRLLIVIEKVYHKHMLMNNL